MSVAGLCEAKTGKRTRGVLPRSVASFFFRGAAHHSVLRFARKTRPLAVELERNEMKCTAK